MPHPLTDGRVQGTATGKKQTTARLSMLKNSRQALEKVTAFIKNTIKRMLRHMKPKQIRKPYRPMMWADTSIGIGVTKIHMRTVRETE